MSSWAEDIAGMGGDLEFYMSISISLSSFAKNPLEGDR
jgi:hypothetical protein